MLPACRILASGRSIIDSRMWHGSLHDAFWRLYRNDEDGAWLHHRSQRLPMRSGVSVVVPPWSAWSGNCSTRVTHRFVHFEVLGLPAAVSNLRTGHPAELPVDVKRDLLLEQLPARADGPVHERIAWQQALLAVVTCVIDPASSHASDDETDRSVRLISPAISLIENNPARHLSVALLARHCGITRDRLLDAFRCSTGQSPARYVLERRVIQVAERLSRSDEPIEDIATACGFADRAHLSHAFRRVLHTSPAAYRRQLR